MYIISTGCQWRPKDLPPRSSVCDYFDLWTNDGTLERIHYALYEQCREQARREASPTAIIESHGYNAGKKINRTACSGRFLHRSCIWQRRNRRCDCSHEHERAEATTGRGVDATGI
jgi:transposase